MKIVASAKNAGADCRIHVSFDSKAKGRRWRIIVWDPVVGALPHVLMHWTGEETFAAFLGICEATGARPKFGPLVEV